jgi:hypothetical protein
MVQIQNTQDKNRALDILEDAFASSPGMTWMLKRKSKASLRIFLTYFFYEVKAKKGAWQSTDRNGVVFFYHLQNKNQSILNTFRKLYVFLFIMGIKNGVRAIRYKRLIDSIRPKTGWFGWLVATDKNTIGKSAGYEMKNEMFRMADLSNEPIYIETTILRVMILYRSLGYDVYHVMQHPYEDLTIWFLKRDPNPLINNMN